MRDQGRGVVAFLDKAFMREEGGIGHSFSRNFDWWSTVRNKIIIKKSITVFNNYLFTLNTFF